LAGVSRAEFERRPAIEAVVGVAAAGALTPCRMAFNISLAEAVSFGG
jgi:hypothetical protein